ncbi:hypothetical protein [Enterococcus thailandicus]|uniref:hypothetical protein n=1 Tax=Enterococcus thailandicus TaxID=417368 RepID=UPI0022E1EDE9|nr:hypothetical protein [Enterococcus thailandicus]
MPKKLLWEHREKGCGAKWLASSNKESFLKIASHIFMKRGLITEEATLGTPFIRKKEV